MSNLSRDVLRGYRRLNWSNIFRAMGKEFGWGMPPKSIEDLGVRIVNMVKNNDARVVRVLGSRASAERCMNNMVRGHLYVTGPGGGSVKLPIESSDFKNFCRLNNLIVGLQKAYCSGTSKAEAKIQAMEAVRPVETPPAAWRAAQVEAYQKIQKQMEGMGQTPTDTQDVVRLRKKLGATSPEMEQQWYAKNKAFLAKWAAGQASLASIAAFKKSMEQTNRIIKTTKPWDVAKIPWGIHKGKTLIDQSVSINWIAGVISDAHKRACYPKFFKVLDKYADQPSLKGELEEFFKDHERLSGPDLEFDKNRDYTQKNLDRLKIQRREAAKREGYGVSDDLAQGQSEPGKYGADILGGNTSDVMRRAQARHQKGYDLRRERGEFDPEKRLSEMRAELNLTRLGEFRSRYLRILGELPERLEKRRVFSREAGRWVVKTVDGNAAIRGELKKQFWGVVAREQGGPDYIRALGVEHVMDRFRQFDVNAAFEVDQQSLGLAPGNRYGSFQELAEDSGVVGEEDEGEGAGFLRAPHKHTRFEKTTDAQDGVSWWEGGGDDAMNYARRIVAAQGDRGVLQGIRDEVELSVPGGWDAVNEATDRKLHDFWMMHWNGGVGI